MDKCLGLIKANWGSLPEDMSFKWNLKSSKDMN